MSESGVGKTAMKKAERSVFIEVVLTVTYAVLIALGIRTFIFEPFNIPSGSMKPTLLVGDYLFVTKFSYGYSRYSLPWSLPLFSGRIMAGDGPQRGDVAVFRQPKEPSVDYIKRLIGLPGDRIQVTDGVLYVNGEAVKRERIDDYLIESPNGVQRIAQFRETLPNGKSFVTWNLRDNSTVDNTGVYEVPPGHYFAMGDNRDDSTDSRFLSKVGFVPAENLVGKAQVIFFSTDGSAGLFEPWKWPTAIRYGRLFQWIN